MANTIVIKNRKQSDTAAPTLIQGEVATNLSDKKLFVGEGSSNVVFADMDYYATAVADTHTHSNTSVLDNTTASYTIEDEVKVDHLTVTGAIDLDAINTRVSELDASVVLKGTWDASSGEFPTSTISGESWIVSVDGTVDSVEFITNDRIIAITDNASTTAYTDWHKLDYTDAVLSVAGRSGAVTLTSDDVALGNVINVDTTNADNINDGSTNAVITLTQETNFETGYTHSQSAHAPADANNYVHPTGDGNSHLPVNGTDHDGKIVAATADAGVYELVDAPSGSTNLGQVTAEDQLTITSDTGSNVVIAEASDSIAGLMTTAHHDKLDGIATNANNYTLPSSVLHDTETIDGGTF